MKQPKKLTRDQKIFLTKRGLKAGNYLYIRDEGKDIVFWDKNKKEQILVPKSRL